jgi:hypothetical protein
MLFMKKLAYEPINVSGDYLSGGGGVSIEQSENSNNLISR